MGVLRNSISLSLTLSLILGSTSVFAEGDIFSQAPAPQKGSRVKQDTRVKPRTVKEEVTSRAPESIKKAEELKLFCNGAPAMMKKLNDENVEKMEKIESLKTDIEDVKNAMVILNGVNQLKNSYENALKDLEGAKAQSLIEQEKDKYKTLENMKKVIRNGLTINALALLIKGGELDKENSFKVSTICSRAVNEKEPLCRNEMGFFQQVKSKVMDNPLDKTLENFKEAYNKVKKGDNKVTLVDEIQKIISSIPEEISPQAIISLLDRTSPGITSILESKVNKDDLTKCLSPMSSKEVLNACENLLPAKNRVKPASGVPTLSFMERMSNETAAAVQGIDGLSEIINETSKANIRSFGSEMNAYSSIGKGVNPQITQAVDNAKNVVMKQADVLEQRIKSQNEKQPRNGAPIELALQKAREGSRKLTGLSTLFYNPDFQKGMSAQVVDNIHEAEMTRAMTSAQKWKAQCVEGIKDTDINYCRTEIENVSKKVDGLKTEFKNKLANLETEFKSINVDEDNKFSKIEILKKFVAGRYFSKCVDPSKFSVKKDAIKFDVKIDGKCYSGGHTLSSIEGLAENMDKIKIFGETKYAENDVLGTFSEADMEAFKNACDDKSIASSHNTVCSEVVVEKVARAEVQERKQAIAKKSAEWEKFNEDNWVSYNDKSSKGYTYAKKRSAASVFASGVLPVVPQMLPMIIGNYMMRQNIDTLTSQALYQKQMLHNYDVYNSNPWMYNYFGSSSIGVQGYGNPFSTPTNTGVNNTAGFGF